MKLVSVNQLIFWSVEEIGLQLRIAQVFFGNFKQNLNEITFLECQSQDVHEKVPIEHAKWSRGKMRG